MRPRSAQEDMSSGSAAVSRGLRPGIALVITLVVILLITTLLSQFNTTTTLELRSLQTQKEEMQARALARSAFKAIQTSLLQDQSTFLPGYRQLKSVLALSAVPWEDGLLTELEVEPLDPLFNVNRLHALQPGSAKDDVMQHLFQKTLEDVVPVSGESNVSAEPMQSGEINRLYAALFDWLDKDDTLYTAIPGTVGAEAAEYFADDPPRAPPNRELERLSEIRLARGIAESRIAWKDWRERFTIHEPERYAGNLYPGVLNVNAATPEQIVRFLQARELDAARTARLDSTTQGIQEALNEYAQNAEAIAAEIAPQDGVTELTARTMKMSEIKSELARAGISANRTGRNLYKQVFTVADEYFRVRLVTMVGATTAELEAVLLTERGSDRTAKSAELLEYKLR